MTKPVTLVAATGAQVEVSWDTSEPYQSTIECSSSSSGVVISGLTIRHRSPSIANNYAVRLVDSDARLEGCDISSSSGSALGIEGNSPHILNCLLHGCERTGALLFGSLDDSPSVPVIRDCRVFGNKLHGIIVRDGAAPRVSSNEIYGNGGWGLALQSCDGCYEGNRLHDNRAGAIAYNLLEEGLDMRDVVSANDLASGPVRQLAL